MTPFTVTVSDGAQRAVTVPTLFSDLAHAERALLRDEKNRIAAATYFLTEYEVTGYMGPSQWDWGSLHLRGSTARALIDLNLAASCRFPLAVYGTLKSGGENHHLIESPRLSEATAGGWVVFENHLYPGLGAVALEFYPFQDLDAFEEGYTRTLIRTSAGMAWVYV
jgi:gamma-glutamylcyclotransferase (GGCT)/AIG2-like uncharacterized protein YtfP